MAESVDPQLSSELVRLNGAGQDWRLDGLASGEPGTDGNLPIVYYPPDAGLVGNGWRYIAQRIAGPDKGDFLDWEVPLAGAEIGFGVLSGPNSLTGTVSGEYGRRLTASGKPLLAKWNTAIWAELNGHIYGGGIVVHSEFEGTDWSIECAGYASYPHGIPYVNEYNKLQVDPLDTVRGLWRHIQVQQTATNLDMVVDNTTSPVRLGERPERVEFTTGAGEDVAFDANGLYRLNWWESPDVGSTIDDLAKTTPFDYLEEHAWSSSSDNASIRHRLRLGYPRIGRRRHDLRFVLGENISTVPTMTDPGDEYANEVIVHGAGEGRAMVRATAAVADGNLRRVAIITDETLDTVARARVVARAELKARSQVHIVIDEINVWQHPNATLGAWGPGDEIFLQVDNGHINIANWYRVIKTTVSPESSDAATLAVIRVES